VIFPFTISSAIFEVQDEPVVAFFFLLPVVFLRCNKRTLAAAAIGLGIWIKIFPIIILPILLFKDKNNRERLFHLLIIAAISLIIILPYLILCPSDFMQFLEFYTLGKNGIAGISYWRFLIYRYVGQSGVISFAALVLGMGSIYYWLVKSKKNVWESCLIAILFFFIFYRKIHGNYYLYPLALLSPLCLMDKDIRRRTLLLVGLVLCTQPFDFPGRGEFLPVIPLILSVATLVVLISIVLKITRADILNHSKTSLMS
jgi:hypothetical protein